MITRSKIKQLEEKCSEVTGKNDKKVVVRDVNEDHKLIDKNGNLLTEKEVIRIEAENKEIQNGGGTVINLRQYD